ncbi:alpha/beta fold hydrolase [Massilia eburnea]|uniref:alpha/beta fold hydrolase n=1 Tax=Massilia eburnea TaxID=1776165 RepID=UPI003D6AC193
MKSVFAFLLVCICTLPSYAAETIEGDVKSGAATLHYWSQGHGSPIVLLSGGPGFASYLHPVMAELAKSGHQAIMVDQRGTGKSTVAPLDESTISSRLLVEDLEVLRKHIGIQRWNVLGHSWGGMLAMRYGIAHQAAVNSLVLVGSGPMFMGAEFDRYFEDNIHSRLLPSDLEAEAYWMDPQRHKDSSRLVSVERLRAILPAYFYDRKNSLAFHQDLGAPGVKNELMGRQDPIGETTQYQIRDACRTARLVFVEQSGHFPWLEQPAAFYRSINSFLDGDGLPRETK